MVKYDMNPVLLVLCMMTLVFAAFNCFAIGFGPSKLHSYLNEPLDLDIELVDAESIAPDNLSASLASVDDFKRAEMQRPYFLSRLRFEVKRIGRRSFIKVTSPEAIKQAFLDFLVDLSYPSGHSVKGYTILLDPAPATSAKRNAVPDFAQNSKTNNKNEVKTDKHSMETLFGPEDKTQIPVSPKIEQVTRDAHVAESEPKQNESNNTNESLGSRTEAVSLPGKIVNSFSNDQKNSQNKIMQNKTTPPAVSNANSRTNVNNTNLNNKDQKDKNRNTHAEANLSQNLEKSTSSHNPQLPVHKQSGERGLPVWLFWTSILAVLCIVSLTIWALNKYRLAKPKQRSEKEYFEAIGAQKTNDSKGFFDRRRLKSETLAKTTIEPDPSLKEELELKLVLAAQYIEVNDHPTAKKLLDEIIAKGTDQQKAEANNLLMKMSIND